MTLPALWLKDDGVIRCPVTGRQTAPLTPRQAVVFETLLDNHPRITSKALIMDAVYGLEGDEPSDKIVDIYIHQIRDRLRTAQTRLWIENQWGRGYLLVTRDPPPRAIIRPRCEFRAGPLLRMQAERVWKHCAAQAGRFVPRAVLAEIADVRRKPGTRQPIQLHHIVAYLRLTGRPLLIARAGKQHGYFVEISSQQKLELARSA